MSAEPEYPSEWTGAWKFDPVFGWFNEEERQRIAAGIDTPIHDQVYREVYEGEPGVTDSGRHAAVERKT